MNNGLSLREMQTFFFDVLGIMPIGYYGARGDNRTDNYANIQIAIDDAIRRGKKYIYVPIGTYLYWGELNNVDKVKFVGHPDAKIKNVRTGEVIKVIQFGICDKDCIKVEDGETDWDFDIGQDEDTGFTIK